ncbi:hypothetical protein BDP27DRAFT_1374679 [Rhodocollybia butyracea]|uniref:Uncharacterized protein n=1 Tax=Rhodocollybia butyracea TaxID=206335 RepID=A0A9P5P2K7_9AGAR|nr:hypothetical protein BDP27DRAFT_1374679 [Rhodocollybia butyracea]
MPLAQALASDDLEKIIKSPYVELEWLLSTTTLEAIACLSAQDYDNAAHPLIQNSKWDIFFRHIGDAAATAGTNEASQALHDSLLYYSQWTSQAKTEASHFFKHQLILNLGLNFKAYAICEALMCGDTTFTLPCGTTLKLVCCDPDPKPKFASYHHLYDIGGPHMRKGGKAVDEANGFLIVQANESILFYSGALDPAYFNDEHIELIVMQGVAQPQPEQASKKTRLGPTDSDVFFTWLLVIIAYAVWVRTNTWLPAPCVRSGHEGIMAQFGINEDTDRIAHNKDLNGAAGIFCMPTKVTTPVVKKLQENAVPHLGSRYIEPGKGFHIQIGDAAVIFPDASCAPPELYLTRG